MEQGKKTGLHIANQKTKTGSGYFLMNVFLMFILPLFSILWEHVKEGTPYDWALIGKWVIFWSIGIRLFTAGVRQASNPEFTATHIFHFRSKESLVVIRELGFANISIGVMGILSVINPNWRPIAAIAGGFFFGMAGIQHLFKKPDSRNEIVALIYDLFVFAVVILYLSFTFF